MTSFGVVARIKRVLNEQQKAKGAAGPTDSLHGSRDEEKPLVVPHKRQRIKVGHTGTLDPFATGLMILVIGDECKRAGVYTKLDKWYDATIVLGSSSTTGDPEGEITRVSDHIPSRQQIDETVAQFRGEITQRPPIFSAIKIAGQRAYDLARAGKLVEIPERQVTVYQLEVLDYTYPAVTIRTHVSSGTYIRSLAVDIGAALGTGAYCRDLKRTQIAQWSVADAKSLADFGIVN